MSVEFDLFFWYNMKIFLKHFPRTKPGKKLEKKTQK